MVHDQPSPFHFPTVFFSCVAMYLVFNYFHNTNSTPPTHSPYAAYHFQFHLAPVLYSHPLTPVLCGFSLKMVHTIPYHSSLIPLHRTSLHIFSPNSTLTVPRSPTVNKIICITLCTFNDQAHNIRNGEALDQYNHGLFVLACM